MLEAGGGFSCMSEAQPLSWVGGGASGCGGPTLFEKLLHETLNQTPTWAFISPKASDWTNRRHLAWPQLEPARSGAAVAPPPLARVTGGIEGEPFEAPPLVLVSGAAPADPALHLRPPPQPDGKTSLEKVSTWGAALIGRNLKAERRQAEAGGVKGW